MIDDIMSFLRIRNYEYNFMTNILKINSKILVEDFLKLKKLLKENDIVLTNLIVEEGSDVKKEKKQTAKISIK